MEEKTFRGLREIALLGFIAVALFFLISLITFSNEDAGWTHSGSVQTISNACGIFGAWLSDIMLSCFGLVAYLFPVIIFWQGYLLYTRGRHDREKMIIALQWIGSIATIISSAALLNLYLLRIGIELPSNTGGILGQETGNVLLRMLGNSGATLLLLVVLLAGVTLVTGLSWVALLDFIGKYTVSICRFLRRSILTLLQGHSVKPIETRVNNPEKSVFKRKVSAKAIPVANIEKRVENPAKNSRPLKKQPAIKYDSSKGVLPSLDLLDLRDTRVIGYSQTDLEEMSRLVEDILADFNVAVTVVGFHPGPVITRFELQPAAGVKVSRISTLSKDLARALSVTSVRIVEIIPGKSVVGLEIPNREREMVTLRELLVSAPFEKSKSMLTLAMGKDISGTPMVADLGKMPHALVAGTTGSGKSVAINTMILSLLYKATPEQVRLIMIDPKMLELSVYEGIPHLLTPVVTDMKEASNALRWAVAEMERRYKLMSKMGVRNLAGFNQLIEDATARGESVRDPMFQMINPLEEGEDYPSLNTLPSIVIVIDELADMMMIVGKKVEELIARLAQKARAAGIHLVLATQRPSVDVLTGLIKANVPTRISFQVSSRIDSRTILDQGGAETLLGNGDMLFLPSGTSIPIRAHGAFVDDHEVHRVVEFLKQTAPPNYLEDITRESSDSNDGYSMSGGNGGDSESDALYDDAVQFVTETRKASISSVQRRFKVGYNRAATMIEDMEAAGVVSSPESNGSRVVLAPAPVRD
ncbi:MAG: DNA translocase FtsK 4TM domain-containing protein [Methylobacter sp.]|uniref:DNA translocase FtsK n=1 Tax=Candidatus Methylobacter titanis TaxID=3053457 RepID=A0AA43TK39_9GAMM|nr:DNA translocase FtsK 4TM domain-containing protein [Candidatus Methylobacter titanis]MDI1292096.1 DNA translocase FtsK 4TM domain-containing protein [Candidatus Methylobacter titanis]